MRQNPESFFAEVFFRLKAESTFLAAECADIQHGLCDSCHGWNGDICEVRSVKADQIDLIRRNVQLLNPVC